MTAPCHYRRQPRPLRPGDVVSLSPDGLPMRIVAVLPDGSLRVKWTSGGKEFIGRFAYEDLELFRP